MSENIGRIILKTRELRNKRYDGRRCSTCNKSTKIEMVQTYQENGEKCDRMETLRNRGQPMTWRESQVIEDIRKLSIKEWKKKILVRKAWKKITWGGKIQQLTIKEKKLANGMTHHNINGLQSPWTNRQLRLRKENSHFILIQSLLTKCLLFVYNGSLDDDFLGYINLSNLLLPNSNLLLHRTRINIG